MKKTINILGVLMLMLLANVNVRAQKKWTKETLAKSKHIALVNDVKFKNAKFNNAHAGTAFLLDTGNEIVACTAKHVLFFAKSKAMNSVHFRGTLETWAFHPKGDNSHPIVADKLLNADMDEKLDPAKIMSRDCIVFTLKSQPKHIQTLKLRHTPLQTNETVFVLGYPYADKSNTQNIYQGKFVKNQGNNLLVKLEDTKIRLNGMSGGAVIDEQGRLVGLVSRMIRDPKTKEMYLAPTSTKYLQEVLKKHQKI